MPPEGAEAGLAAMVRGHPCDRGAGAGRARGGTRRTPAGPKPAGRASVAARVLPRAAGPSAPSPAADPIGPTGAGSGWAVGGGALERGALEPSRSRAARASAACGPFGASFSTRAKSRFACSRSPNSACSQARSHRASTASGECRSTSATTANASEPFPARLSSRTASRRLAASGTGAHTPTSGNAQASRHTAKARAAARPRDSRSIDDTFQLSAEPHTRVAEPPGQRRPRERMQPGGGYHGKMIVSVRCPCVNSNCVNVNRHCGFSIPRCRSDRAFPCRPRLSPP